LSLPTARLPSAPVWVLHGIRFFVGAIFIYAGTAKWIAPQSFAQATDSFHLLPPILVSTLSITLPPLEILAGGLWVLNRYAKVAAATILLLCLAFLIALATAIIAGIPAECGCFGTLFGTSLSAALARDLFLTGATAYWLLADMKRQSMVPVAC